MSITRLHKAFPPSGMELMYYGVSLNEMPRETLLQVIEVEMLKKDRQVTEDFVKRHVRQLAQHFRDLRRAQEQERRDEQAAKKKGGGAQAEDVP